MATGTTLLEPMRANVPGLEEPSLALPDKDRAFCLAAASGHMEVLFLLIEHGANPFAQNSWPSRAAKTNGHDAVVMLLSDLAMATKLVMAKHKSCHSVVEAVASSAKDE